MISSNWQQLVKQQQVDPVNPAPVRAVRKRKVDDCSAAVHIASSLKAGPAAVQPGEPRSAVSSFSSSSSPSSLSSQPTLLLAMDCEMVGVGADGIQHSLARCSIVNSLGVVLYDRYVQSVEAVTDYRTAVSGILPHHIQPSSAVTFSQCQTDVAALLTRRILIGHALHSDLAVLQLSHPRHLTRDTSRWKGLCPHRPRALRVLAEEQLGVSVQCGQHDSVEDARTALQLYMKHRKEWELSIKQAKKKHQQQQQHRTKAASQPSRAAAERQQREKQPGNSTNSRWSSEGPIFDVPLMLASPVLSSDRSNSAIIKRMKRH